MFEDIKLKIDKAIKNCMNDLVDHAVDRLIDESPVYTGEFVNSMIAEAEAKDYPRSSAPSGDIHGEGLKADEIAIKSAAKIKLKSTAKVIIEETGKVAINNTAMHANFVEYLGWIPFGGKTDKYFPFGKAKESIILNKTRICNLAKSRAFKK